MQVSGLDFWEGILFLRLGPGSKDEGKRPDFFLGSTVDSRFKGFKLAKKSGPVEGQC